MRGIVFKPMFCSYVWGLAIATTNKCNHSVFTHLNFESDLITRLRAFERARHLFARDLALKAAAIEVFAMDSARGVKRGDAPRTNGKLLLI